MAVDDRETGALFDEIKAFRQTPFVPNVWRSMAGHPALLRATWERFRTLMGPGHLPPEVKEMIALAVAVTNGCRYNIRVHNHMLRNRFGLGDAAMLELYGVIDLFNGINAFAQAAEIVPDTPPPGRPD